MFNRGCMILLLTLTSACRGGNNTVTSPSPSPTVVQAPTPAPTSIPSAMPLSSISLTGEVTNRMTSKPIPGAKVMVSYPPPMPSAITDSLGRYNLIGLMGPGGGGLVWATADNYEDDLQYHRSAVQNFRLYAIQRITAGASMGVTVGPDDTLCWTDTHAPGWGADFVCRIVRIAVPSDGILTVEALPTGGGARPPLVVQLIVAGRLLDERLGNPTSVRVTAGTEAVAFVEIPSSETTKQSFTLNTVIRAATQEPL
jgi:hypothetical protein